MEEVSPTGIDPTRYHIVVPEGMEVEMFERPHRVHVSFGVTINTGNFSSVRMDVSDEFDVPEGMSPLEARQSSMQELQNEIRAYMVKVKAENAPKIPKEA